MKFTDLIDFIENRMSMSHIYQPLLLKSLADAGGASTIRQLAFQFLAQDESQIAYYEKRIKEMPLKVLRKHGIVSKDNDLVSLNVKKLTFEQKAHIKMLCEQKLQEFVLKRGLGIWDYRMIDKDPVPDNLYYRVLKESQGKCALCGTSKNERPLHVDHIIPRSKGGKTVYENLQALCQKCNLAKGNKDKTDFRQESNHETVKECPLCYGNAKSRIMQEYETVFAIKDKYPVSDGHLLIIPKRHTPDFFTLTENERADANSLIRTLQKQISSNDPTVTGFNIGANSGESAGQTIFHAHIHLIPRRDGDTPNPRGGVRGVIPDRMNY